MKMKEHRCTLLADYEKITSQSSNAWYYQVGEIGEDAEHTMMMIYCHLCGVKLNE